MKSVLKFRDIFNLILIHLFPHEQADIIWSSINWGEKNILGVKAKENIGTVRYLCVWQ